MNDNSVQTIVRELLNISQELIDKHRSKNAGRKGQRTDSAQHYLDAIRRGENPTIPVHSTGEYFGPFLYAAVDIASLVHDVRALASNKSSESPLPVSESRWYSIDLANERWSAIGKLREQALSILTSLKSQNERDIQYVHDIDRVQLFLRRLIDELELLKICPGDLRDVADFAEAAKSIPVFTDTFKVECLHFVASATSILSFLR